MMYISTVIHKVMHVMEVISTLSEINYLISPLPPKRIRHRASVYDVVYNVFIGGTYRLSQTNGRVRSFDFDGYMHPSANYHFRHPEEELLKRALLTLPTNRPLRAMHVFFLMIIQRPFSIDYRI